MDADEKLQALNNGKELSRQMIQELWLAGLNQDTNALNQLKNYYMKILLRIKPLYAYLSSTDFYSLIESSVEKALERGLKFQVENIDAYMLMSSQTYFKFFLDPSNDSLQLPVSLMKAFSKLDEVYRHLPALAEKTEQEQIALLARGFEYPIFLTRLLYYSFIKWQKNTLRQVDIDLTVTLLPPPKRVEWEVFYEKALADIEATISSELEK